MYDVLQIALVDPGTELFNAICHCPPARTSGPAGFPRLSVPAAWARSTARDSGLDRIVPVKIRPTCPSSNVL
jgi:hypothetical protein